MRASDLVVWILVVLIVGGSASHARDIFDPIACTAMIHPEAEGGSVFVIPDGSGVPLSAAFAPGGAIVDATIMVVLIDTDGNYLVGVPREDLWLATSNGGLVTCGAAIADSDTDQYGQTTFSMPVRAGGSSDGEYTLVVLWGAPLYTTIDLTFNSADLNGDLDIDLTDIVLFAQLIVGDYDYAADFNHDGVVDLSDVVRFVLAIGVVCVP